MRLQAGHYLLFSPWRTLSNAEPFSNEISLGARAKCGDERAESSRPRERERRREGGNRGALQSAPCTTNRTRNNKDEDEHEDEDEDEERRAGGEGHTHTMRSQASQAQPSQQNSQQHQHQHQQATPTATESATFSPTSAAVSMPPQRSSKKRARAVPVGPVAVAMAVVSQATAATLLPGTGSALVAHVPASAPTATPALAVAHSPPLALVDANHERRKTLDRHRRASLRRQLARLATAVIDGNTDANDEPSLPPASTAQQEDSAAHSSASLPPPLPPPPQQQPPRTASDLSQIDVISGACALIHRLALQKTTLAAEVARRAEQAIASSSSIRLARPAAADDEDGDSDSHSDAAREHEDALHQSESERDSRSPWPVSSRAVYQCAFCSAPPSSSSFPCASSSPSSNLELGHAATSTSSSDDPSSSPHTRTTATDSSCSSSSPDASTLASVSVVSESRTLISSQLHRYNSGDPFAGLLFAAGGVCALRLAPDDTIMDVNALYGLTVGLKHEQIVGRRYDQTPLACRFYQNPVEQREEEEEQEQEEQTTAAPIADLVLMQTNVNMTAAATSAAAASLILPGELSLFSHQTLAQAIILAEQQLKRLAADDDDVDSSAAPVTSTAAVAASSVLSVARSLPEPSPPTPAQADLCHHHDRASSGTDDFRFGDIDFSFDPSLASSLPWLNLPSNSSFATDRDDHDQLQQLPWSFHSNGISPLPTLSPQPASAVSPMNTSSSSPSPSPRPLISPSPLPPLPENQTTTAGVPSPDALGVRSVSAPSSSVPVTLHSALAALLRRSPLAVQRVLCRQPTAWGEVLESIMVAAHWPQSSPSPSLTLSQVAGDTTPTAQPQPAAAAADTRHDEDDISRHPIVLLSTPDSRRLLSIARAPAGVAAHTLPATTGEQREHTK